MQPYQPPHIGLRQNAQNMTVTRLSVPLEMIYQILNAIDHSAVSIKSHLMN